MKRPGKFRRYRPLLVVCLVAAAFLGGNMLDLFADSPPIQRAFYQASVAIWLFGGIALLLSYQQRVRGAHGLGARLLPFLHFNRQEWLSMAALLAGSIALAIIGTVIDGRQ